MSRSRISFVRGDRVTLQPDRWHDGTPVEHWPAPELVGTVIRTEKIAGLLYARVKYPGGRLDWHKVTELYAVPR